MKPTFKNVLYISSFSDFSLGTKQGGSVPACSRVGCARFALNKFSLYKKIEAKRDPFSSFSGTKAKQKQKNFRFKRKS
jgi:hypothetical protein